MRSDMGKVLVERPRIGGNGSKSDPAKGYRKRLDRCLASGDSPPNCEGIKQRYGSDRKIFNEHLGPLRRYLESNVGRPWNKIYAEICKYVNRGNVVQKHILTHLFQYVITDVILINGQPCRGGNASRRFGESLRETHYGQQWYVCPKSGLLKRSRYVPWKRRRPESPRRVVLNKKQICLFLAGQWELITVKPIPGTTQPHGFDVIFKKGVGGCFIDSEPMRLYGANVYAVDRRPLSRRELLALPIPIEWLP